METKKTATQIIQEVKEDMCNKYCKYTSGYMGIDPDMEFDDFVNKYCENCPLDRL